MSGLGQVTESGVIFLGIAGGFVWDKKADESHGAYSEQKFSRVDGTEGVRKGAKYADITGKIVEIKFPVHQQYGEHINLTIDAGDDRYIVALKIGNRYSQDIMKGILLGDIEKPFRIKPFAFPDKENPTKIVQGCNIFQDAEKIDLKGLEVIKPEGCTSDEDVKNFFKTATPKKRDRYFDDLNEWLKAEILEEVVSGMPEAPRKEGKPAVNKPKPAPTAKPEETESEAEAKATEVVEQEAPKPLTPLKMKQALRAYSAENYEGREIPKTLAGAELIQWYDLSVAGEDLPWSDEEGSDASEVKPKDISSQLDALRG